LTTNKQLDEWIRRNAGRAVAYAESLLRNPALAEDVVQDTFCNLIKHKDRYDLLKDGEKILFKSLTNACINITTRRRKMTSLELGEEAGGSLADRTPQTRFPDPEKVAEGKELAAAIEEGLARLPENQRAALHLKTTGSSLKEIAEILGVTESNAGVLVHRARRAMAEWLAPLLDTEQP